MIRSHLWKGSSAGGALDSVIAGDNFQGYWETFLEGLNGFGPERRSSDTFLGSHSRVAPGVQNRSKKMGNPLGSPLRFTSIPIV
jgi:hypothetical protein